MKELIFSESTAFGAANRLIVVKCAKPTPIRSHYAHGVGYLLENMIYLDLHWAGYDVTVGTLEGGEADFVAQKPMG